MRFASVATVGYGAPGPHLNDDRWMMSSVSVDESGFSCGAVSLETFSRNEMGTGHHPFFTTVGVQRASIERAFMGTPLFFDCKNEGAERHECLVREHGPSVMETMTSA